MCWHYGEFKFTDRFSCFLCTSLTFPLENVPHFTSLYLSVQPALFPAHPCWGHCFPLYRDSRHSQALERQLLLTNRLIQSHCFLLIANQQQPSHRVTCPVSHICLSRTCIIYFWTPGVPSLYSGCFKLLAIPGNKGVTNAKQY